ncbi:hypothetical protein ACFL02_04310, partial [Planctomycetota bacterium]
GYLGNWTFRDLFSKPKSACSSEQLDAIRTAKSLGVLTLNGETGNGCCCVPVVNKCRETEIEWRYCAHDEFGECVAYSDPCDDNGGSESVNC